MSITPAQFKTPYFRWKDPFVTIRVTDTELPQEPPAPTEAHDVLEEDDPKWKQRELTWRMKLGELIVHDYLAINPGSYKDGKKYFLSRFPTNYVFYVLQRTNPNVQTKMRYDCYLHGGGHTFRSPNEFIFHAAWLMAGAPPGQCSCVYCDSDNPGQKERSRSIEENRQLVRQRIRRFKEAGVKIERGLNAMNRKAFLKMPAKGKKSVSFEEEEEEGEEGEEDELEEETPADTNSSGGASRASSDDRVVRLVHGYDEESGSDQDTQQ